MNTISAPAVRFDTAPENVNPALIHRAAKLPLRLLVRNVSGLGLNVHLSYDSATLQTGMINPQNAFVLPPGASDVFPLLPGEALFCTSPNLTAGIITYAVTVAFPFEVDGARPPK